MTNISYDTYNKGGHLIEFWLKNPPSLRWGFLCICNWRLIKKQLLPILLSQLAGCIGGYFRSPDSKTDGEPPMRLSTLAQKSVTTPIAMEVTKSIGGIPALTAAVVVCVGLLGGILGFKTMKLTHIGKPHGPRAFFRGSSPCCRHIHSNGHQQQIRCFASLSLTLNGIFTALLTPYYFYDC